MWLHPAKRLILASASPRREQLLTQIQVPVTKLVVPAPGEDEPRLAGESVTAYVTRTASDKLDRTAQYWRSEHPDEPVPPMLAADTTVALGQTILSKPVDAADAKRILLELIGHAHDVYTAVVLLHEGKRLETLVHATVTINTTLISVLDDYIATGEPFGKAGAYAIQGIAAAHIDYVGGSYTAVVGLPLFETAQLLRQAKLYR